MIRARIEQGDYANQVRRLAKVYGKDIDEMMRAQARLFVRDAMKLTPPTGKSALSEKWPQQLEAGKVSVLRDVKRKAKAASTVKVLSVGANPSGASGPDKWARLYRKSKDQFLDVLRDKAKLNFRDVFPELNRENASALIRSKQKRKTLIYDGTPPQYDAGKGPLFVSPEFAAVVEHKWKLLGIAKAGWMKAANALGLKGVPKWIKRHAGVAEGVYVHPTVTGWGTSYTVGSAVGYMQSTGARRRVIERAWESRRIRIAGEIKAAMRAMNRKNKGAK